MVVEEQRKNEQEVQRISRAELLYDVIPEEKVQQQSGLSSHNATLKPATVAASGIRISDLLRSVKAADGDAYFRETERQEHPLVALHNTDARKIRHIAKMQGIAVPSIGIARADIPYESFGDISLIGDTQLGRYNCAPNRTKR